MQKLRKVVESRPIIILYSLLLFALCLLLVNDNNFWGDECYTIRLSQMSIRDMVSATSIDAHPPLYYIFTIIGQRLCGTAGWMYHLVSVIPYAIVLVLSNTIIWKRFGAGTTYLFVTLCSVLPNALEYNVEARMYSWASLFVLCSFYFVLKILNEDSHKNYMIFALFSLLAAYTHYYALLSVAFFYVALLILAIWKKKSIKNVLITYAVTVVAYLPWVSVMFSTLVRTKDGWWLNDIEKLSDCLAFIFDVRIAPVSIAILMLTVALVMVRAIKKKDEVSTWSVIGVSAAFLTLAVGQGSSYLVRPFFLVRYLYPIAGVVWLILSVVVGKLGHDNEESAKKNDQDGLIRNASFAELKLWIPYIATALIILLCVRTDKNIITTSRGTDARCRETVSELTSGINETETQSTPMILSNSSHMNWTILDYYFPGVAHSGEIDALDANMCYYLVWEGDVSEDEKARFDANGFTPKKIFEDGVIGTTRVQVYELLKKTDAE